MAPLLFWWRQFRETWIYKVKYFGTMIVLTSLVQSQENNECLRKPSFNLQRKDVTWPHQSYNLSAPSTLSETEALIISGQTKINGVSTFKFSQIKNVIIKYVGNKIFNLLNTKPLLKKNNNLKPVLQHYKSNDRAISTSSCNCKMIHHHPKACSKTNGQMFSGFISYLEILYYVNFL